ncbi:hypothetical protein DL89DRAFT_269608 [Linderina pennispora]|uniref:Uncharacterized protein n=1 Tax=Linderina pennispora TaxID=61395 RepID=A0A1Y1W1K1_9FUNG|nr:uncharacterized protein DL89DRAFT_269608 [Linderina pennispora]ORX67185.1 hypothetical protein DL89DRAFT_269608 [Linderina pennispora]
MLHSHGLADSAVLRSAPLLSYRAPYIGWELLRLRLTGFGGQRCVAHLPTCPPA